MVVDGFYEVARGVVPGGGVSVWVGVGDGAVAGIVAAPAGAIVGDEGFCERLGVCGVDVLGDDLVSAFVGADEAAGAVIAEGVFGF